MLTCLNAHAKNITITFKVHCYNILHLFNNKICQCQWPCAVFHLDYKLKIIANVYLSIPP